MVARSRATRQLSVLPLATVLLLPLLVPFVGANPNILPPLPPLNPNPADGAGPLGLTVSASWTGGDVDSSSVVSYVNVSANGGPPTNACITTTTHCTITNLPYAAAVQWHVDAYDGEHTTSGAWWNFTTKQAPVTPNSPSPADNATGVSRDQVATWNSSDPDGFPLTYRVTLTPDGANTTTRCDHTTAKSCNFGHLLPSKTYTWQVFANDTYHETAGPVWTFTTAADVAPDTPTLTSPDDGATVSPRDITFSWTGGDGDGDVVHYQVQATGPGGMEDSTICATDAHSCIVTLDLNSTYTWLVRADDTFIASSSGTRTLHTRNNSAPYVTNASPSDDERNVTRDPTLSWVGHDADNDSLLYTVTFGTNTSPTTRICANQTATSCSAGHLNANTRYHWQVGVNDSFGEVHSQVYTFVTIASQPPVFGTLSPIDGTVGSATTRTLTWTATDPESDALHYTVYLSANDPHAYSPLAACTNLIVTSCTASGLAYDTGYYWWVIATDGSNSVESDHLEFRTRSTAAPDAASGPVPLNVAAGAPSSHLAWTARDSDGDAVTYTVYGRVWGSSTSNPISGCIAVSIPACTPTGIPASSLVRWFVEADDGRLKARSTEWTFTTPWSGTGTTDTEGFSSLPPYTASGLQVFSRITWDASNANVQLVSDGRDTGNIEYTRALATSLPRTQSWSTESETTFTKLGANQQANLLGLAATGGTLGLATSNQLSIMYRSPGSTSPGISIPNAYGLTSSSPWTPVIGHTYTTRIEFDAATQALTVRVSDKTAAATIFEASRKIAASAAFGPFATIGFATIGQSKSVSSSDEATDVRLDNVAITAGGTLTGAIPIYLNPLPGATGVGASPTLTWSSAGYAAGSLFDAKVYDSTGTLVASCINVATSCAVTGLTAGGAYSWSVAPHGGSTTTWPLRVVAANNAPEFTSLTTQANQGNFVFDWTASDADSDPLTYTVYYAKSGEDLVPVCKTYLTECTVAAWAPGTDVSWRVDASDGSSITPSAPQSSTGPVPNIRYFVDSDGRDFPIGEPAEFDGWTFESVPSCVPSTTHICVTVTATATTGNSAVVGWGFAGLNTGVVQPGILGESYRWAIDVSQGSCSASASLTMTPTSGTTTGMRFSYGSSIYSQPNVRFGYGSTSGAKGVGVYVQSCGSDSAYVDISFPSASTLDGAASGTTFHVDNPPTHAKISLAQSYDSGLSASRYDGTIDFDYSGSSNGWLNLGGAGTVYVDSIPSHYYASIWSQSGNVIKACGGLSGTPYYGSNFRYEKTSGDPTLRIAATYVKSLDACLNPNGRHVDASASYYTDYWSGQGYGTTDITAYSGTTKYVSISTASLGSVSLYADFTDTVIDGGFTYSGDITFEAQIPNLMWVKVTQVPHSLTLYISKTSTDYNYVYFSGTGGDSRTRIETNGAIGGNTFVVDYQRLKDVYFYYYAPGSPLISVDFVNADYFGSISANVHTSLADITMSGQNIKNWDVHLYTSGTNDLVVGAHLKTCYTCGSINIQAHRKITSWSGVTAYASISRYTDGRYQVNMPLVATQYINEGGWVWVWYVITYVDVYARAYKA